MRLSKLSINITDGVHNTIIDDNNGNNYLLSCKNIKNGKIIITNKERRINNATLINIRRHSRLQYNDILLTTVGTIGQTAIVKDIEPNFDFQRSVGIIKCNNLVLPKYLLYYLQSNSGQTQIKSFVKGAVQSCLFLNDISNIEIPYIEINEQQHIVDTIYCFLEFLLLYFLILYFLQINLIIL